MRYRVNSSFVLGPGRVAEVGKHVEMTPQEAGFYVSCGYITSDPTDEQLAAAEVKQGASNSRAEQKAANAEIKRLEDALQGAEDEIERAAASEAVVREAAVARARAEEAVSHAKTLKEAADQTVKNASNAKSDAAKANTAAVSKHAERQAKAAIDHADALCKAADEAEEAARKAGE